MLLRNATWSGFTAAVRAATGLLSAVLAVRLLGGVLYGQVATLLALFVLYLSLNSSVSTILATQLTSIKVGSNQRNAQVDLVSAAGILAVSSILLLGLLVLLLYQTLPLLFSQMLTDSNLSIELHRAVLAMSVLTALQIFTAFYSAVIEGNGRLDLAMKWQLFGSVLITCTLLLLTLLHKPMTALGYVTVLCCGALIDLLMLELARRRLLIAPPSLRLSRERILQIWHLLRSGTTLQLATFMTLFLEPMNKLLLNHFVGALAVTAYDLAMRIIWGIQSLFGAAMRVFLHFSNETEQVVGQAFLRAFTLVLVPVLAAHTVAVILLASIAHQWVKIADPLQLMAFFGIATLSNLGMIYITPLYISLISRTDFRFILKSQAIVAASNTLLSAVLIPYIGLLGSSLGLLCATIYNVIAIYQRHGQIVGKIDVPHALFRAYRLRYAMTALLFLSALLIGGQPGMNYFAAGAILFFIGTIMTQEPLPRLLLQKLRPAK
jgi:O-antigen/teichoic acid export membrane protein